MSGLELPHPLITNTFEDSGVSIDNIWKVTCTLAQRAPILPSFFVLLYLCVLAATGISEKEEVGITLAAEVR